ncbi:Atlastin-1 [Halotydeus destructor]|nr:Atlastin-1 [Halotydeus destructor]
MVKNATGHYDGAYGLLQRDEADISFLPFPLSSEADVAILGPVVLEDKIRFASRAILSTAQVNMVKQLFNFSRQCTLAFLLTYLVLMLSMRATSHVKMSLQEITWRIYEAVLQGMSCYSKHLSSRILSLWVTIGIMFLVFIWSNTITTDMVTANTDRVVYKMADIVRLRKSVFALARDPMMNKFKRSKTKMAELYRKLRVVNINREDIVNPKKLFAEYEKNGVMFSGEVLLELLSHSICAMTGYRFHDNYSPLFDVLNEYFHYATVTRVSLRRPFATRPPSLVMCLTLVSLVPDYETKSFTVKYMYDATPSTDSLIDQCIILEKNSYELSDWLSTRECAQLFVTTKYIKQRYVCYSFDLKNFIIDFKVHHVTNGLHAPRFYKIKLLSPFKGAAYYFLHVTNHELRDHGRSESFTEQFRSLNQSGYGDHNYVSLTYKAFRSRKLPAPYKTNCRNYSEDVDFESSKMNIQPVTILSMVVDEATSISRLVPSYEKLNKILRHENCRERPVCVISIIGSARKGKSVMLNWMLQYLSSSKSQDWLLEETGLNGGFPWRGGSKSATTGIIMWPEPFVVVKDGREVAVLLVDTQGLYDRQLPADMMAQLFAISTLVSSVQILNLAADIQDDNLQYLKTFTDYAALYCPTTSGHPFQKLLFLVRDFEYPDYDFGLEEGQRLLDDRLALDSDRDDVEAAKARGDHLRSYLSDAFEKLECFLLPHPGNQAFVEHTLSPENIVIKMAEGEVVTGPELSIYFRKHVEKVTDMLLRGESIADAMKRALSSDAARKACDYWEDQMLLRFGETHTYFKEPEFASISEQIKRAAVGLYHNRVPHYDHRSFSSYLQATNERIDARTLMFRHLNDAKQFKLDDYGTAITSNTGIAVGAANWLPKQVAVAMVVVTTVIGFILARRKHLRQFPWAGGSESQTRGMIMWSEPIVVTKDGLEIAVLLLDTQGQFDGRLNPSLRAQLFTMSTMMSSVQIYNVSEDIQDDTFQNLKTLTDYATSYCDISDERPFQKLLFLVRDFNYSKYEYGFRGGRAFFEKRLKMGKGQPDIEGVRQSLRNTFQKLDCCLLPYPGNQLARANEELCPLRDIDKEFVKHMEDFIEQALSSELLAIKKMDELNITGSELSIHFHARFDEISDRSLDGTSISERNKTAKSRIVARRTYKNWETAMLLHFTESSPYLEDKAFDAIVAEFTRCEINYFKHKVHHQDHHSYAFYLERVRELIEARTKLYRELNNAKNLQYEDYQAPVKTAAGLAMGAVKFLPQKVAGGLMLATSAIGIGVSFYNRKQRINDILRSIKATKDVVLNNL